VTPRQFRARVTLVFGVWSLLNVYVGAHFAAGTSTLGHVLGWTGGALLAGLPIATLVAARRRPLTPLLGWTGFIALGLSSLLVVGFAIVDLFHLTVAPWVVPGIAALLTGVGVLGARWPRVVRVSVPIAHLPPDLEGFRIVQLSDLHVGPTLKRPFVERVVAAANALAPDVIAFTGDVADGFVPELREAVAPLERLTARHGKFFVTGNHEYYWDAPGWLREVERLGLSVLNHDHRVVQHGAGKLVFAGVPDLSVPSDPRAALAGAPASDVRVLLAHQPKSAFAARAAGFDLQLSGHTHGGQYFPFNLVVRLFQPFVAGLHRLEAMWLYVSRGTGYWGPPLRLGAPPEITLLELTAA
jgi:uncharacterized protein